MCNFAVGTVLVRTTHEPLTERRVIDLLRVEVTTRRGALLRHEDGHAEFRDLRSDLPIERQLFGYRVASADEALLFPVNLILDKA